MRHGAPPAEIVTFAHRRLHEYFVVRYKARARLGFELNWVADDTRERDSAVLQIELSEPAEAERIALALWEEIKKGDDLDYANPQFYRSLNCLRFLIEAFRTRREVLEPFQGDLESMITRRLEKSDDLISIKIAVEAIGLLSPQGLERNVIASLRHGDFWIRETAIDACRFLPSLPPNVVGHLWRCIAFLPENIFVKELHRLRFSFRLSPALEAVFGLIERRAYDIQSWRRWRWIPATSARLPLVPMVVLWNWLTRSFARSREVRGPQTEFLKLYISDRAAYQALNLHYEPPSVIDLLFWQLVQGSLPGGTSDIHRWLSHISGDRSYGLTNYRAALANNHILLWSFTVMLWIILLTPLVFLIDLQKTLDYFLILLIVLAPLISPMFARRTYHMMAPGENVQEPPRE